MAIDFPPVVTDPSQPWTNPDTGITYIYKDGAWRVIAQSNIVDINEEFVNVSGDNMTGALTIGPAGSPVTTLAANGSATFAQKNDNSKVYLTNAGAPGNQRGSIYLYGEAGGTGIVFYVNGAQNAVINYTGSTVFNLEPDNDDNYTTTTDAEGNETRVYNGPTLDVKDRLTKADTALKTLKTAAAAAVDFTELKAAIATALADI